MSHGSREQYKAIMTDQVQLEIGMNDFSIFRLDMVSLSSISVTCETPVSTPPSPKLPGY